jgi:hypothetical protein
LSSLSSFLSLDSLIGHLTQWWTTETVWCFNVALVIFPLLDWPSGWKSLQTTRYCLWTRFLSPTLYPRSSLSSVLSPLSIAYQWIRCFLFPRRSVSFLFHPPPLLLTNLIPVMTLIKNEALLHGKCVALVIHQPRNEIFNLLDDLLLLKVWTSLLPLRPNSSGNRKDTLFTTEGWPGSEKILSLN